MYKYNKTSIHSLLGWRYLEEPETLDEPDCSDITDMSLVRRDRGGGPPPPADRIDSSLARREKGGGTPPPVDGAATTLFSLMSWQMPSYNSWNKLWIRFWDHTYGVAGPYCRLTITIYFHCMLPMHFYLNKKINACMWTMWTMYIKKCSAFSEKLIYYILQMKIKNTYFVKHPARNCNFPINPLVRLFDGRPTVGWSVCHNFLKGRNVHLFLSGYL